MSESTTSHMDRWSHRWEEPKRFEHQDNRYTMGMVSQPHPQEQSYQDHKGYQYASHDSLNNLYFSNNHWSSHHSSNILGAPPDFQQQANDYEPNEPSLAEMIAQLKASNGEFQASNEGLQASSHYEPSMADLMASLMKIQAKFEASLHNTLEQDHDLSTLHSSKLYDSNSLLVHNDDDDVHSYGVEREENVPLGHVVNDIVHHDYILKEDGNREEENIIPRNELKDDVIVDERSEEEDISFGRVLGHLSLDDYEHRDYERRKHERSLSRGTSRH